MTDQHPIIPPPELVQQWRAAASNVPASLSTDPGGRRDYIDYIATEAARWGAAQHPESDPGEIRLTSGKEIIRITPTGFYYREQVIEDAGQCHRLLVDFLRRAMPETDWKHSEHAIVPPLSPAARAVLNAYRDADIDDEATAAAVLRAVANELCMKQPFGDTDADAGVFAAHHAIQQSLLAIAAELEGVTSQ